MFVIEMLLFSFLSFYFCIVDINRESGILRGMNDQGLRNYRKKTRFFD